MKNVSKKISYVSYVIVLVLVFMLVTSTLASEKPVNFTDVPNDSPYYESVLYFVSRGAASAQKDGLFHPEEKMSLQEWQDILTSVGVDATQFPTSSAAIEPADLYSSIWSAANIKTYCASEYGYCSDLDAGTTAMIVTGLIQRDAVGREYVSRGEALRLIHEIVIKKAVTEVPVNLVNFFEVSVGEGCSPESETEVRTLLAKYPNNQLALLLAYRYQFVVLTDLSHAPNGHTEQIGFEDVGEHIIYLRESGISKALIHEVGHAVETCHSSYSKSWKLNKEEGVAGAKVLGEYAGTNASEYIAEATRYFIENRNDEAAMKNMKEAIPQTYEYLSDVMNESAFLMEDAFLAVAFDK